MNDNHTRTYEEILKLFYCVEGLSFEGNLNSLFFIHSFHSKQFELHRTFLLNGLLHPFFGVFLFHPPEMSHYPEAKYLS